MKTYEEFIREAYKKSYGEIDEGLGTLASRAGRFIPGLQTAAGLGLAGYRLYKGDKTGAALAAGSAIPGPIGWGFAGADIAREVGKYQQSQKSAKPKPPTSPKSVTPTTPKPSRKVLSKLGGVEGTGVGKEFVPTEGGWKAGEKDRYENTKQQKFKL